MHNWIEDTSYIGIRLGFSLKTKNTESGSNQIQGNRIIRAMKVLNDGAAIYVNGNLGESSITYNYISDILKTSSHANAGGIFGIYMDRGTTKIRVEKSNFNTQSAFKISHVYSNTITNNIIANVASNDGAFFVITSNNEDFINHSRDESNGYLYPNKNRLRTNVLLQYNSIIPNIFKHAFLVGNDPSFSLSDFNFFYIKGSR